MDRPISVDEASAHFSDILHNVSQGESFTIMAEGQAVARITPVDRASRKEAQARLLTFVRALPRRYSGNWKREDLYE